MALLHLAICHAVPGPVYFTWQCVIRYHNQSISPGNALYDITTSVISPGNMLCGITTSAFHLAICYTYHNQCIPPDNVLYGTTTSVFHLAICYTVSQPVHFTWQYAIRYHNQCIPPDNVLYGK
jgi:hypothetical protein